LARSCRRQAEIAMRISLGASRGRVVRQFITENLTLALMGGVLGLAVAEIGVRCFVAFQPGSFPRGQAIHIDPVVLGFALFVTQLAALFLAWAPVIVFSRLELVSTLKTGLAQAGVVGRWRLRTLLLSEVTLSLTLLLGAGLLLRSFQNAQHVDPGFQPKGLLTAYLRSDDYAASRSFFPEALRRIAAIPEVQSSAASDCMPAASSRQATLVFNDRPNDPYNVPSVEACWVSPGYFRAIGTPLFTGREFSAHDNQEGTPVAIVNRAFAQAYWPRQNPIGKQVSANYVGPGRSLLSSPSYRQVVGVVGDVRQQGLDVPVEPAIYLPYLQDSTDHVFAGLNLFIRTRSDPRAFADSLRAEIHALRPNQPVENVRTMNDVLFRTLAPRRLSLLLFGAFAVLALFLSAIGIYSVIAYTVGQRMRELGIRVALGAQRQDILQTILREGLLLITGGIGLGIVVSACLSKVISGLLFGVSPTDPLTLGAASAVLFAVGTAACLKPARRAAKVDPMVALRYE
jgi:putative ABC transport system permease protein